MGSEREITVRFRTHLIMNHHYSILDSQNTNAVMNHGRFVTTNMEAIPVLEQQEERAKDTSPVSSSEKQINENEALESSALSPPFTKPNIELRILGSAPELGANDINKAPAMSASTLTPTLYEANIRFQNIPPDTEIDYKYVLLVDNEPVWETMTNTQLNKIGFQRRLDVKRYLRVLSSHIRNGSVTLNDHFERVLVQIDENMLESLHISCPCSQDQPVIERIPSDKEKMANGPEAMAPSSSRKTRCLAMQVMRDSQFLGLSSGDVTLLRMPQDRAPSPTKANQYHIVHDPNIQIWTSEEVLVRGWFVDFGLVVRIRALCPECFSIYSANDQAGKIKSESWKDNFSVLTLKLGFGLVSLPPSNTYRPDTSKEVTSLRFFGRAYGQQPKAPKGSQAAGDRKSNGLLEIIAPLPQMQLSPARLERSQLFPFPLPIAAPLHTLDDIGLDHISGFSGRQAIEFSSERKPASSNVDVNESDVKSETVRRRLQLGTQVVEEPAKSQYPDGNTAVRLYPPSGTGDKKPEAVRSLAVYTSVNPSQVSGTSKVNQEEYAMRMQNRLQELRMQSRSMCSQLEEYKSRTRFLESRIIHLQKENKDLLQTKADLLSKMEYLKKKEKLLISKEKGRELAAAAFAEGKNAALLVMMEQQSILEDGIKSARLSLEDKHREVEIWKAKAEQLQSQLAALEARAVEAESIKEDERAVALLSSEKNMRLEEDLNNLRVDYVKVSSELEKSLFELDKLRISYTAELESLRQKNDCIVEELRSRDVEMEALRMQNSIEIEMARGELSSSSSRVQILENERDLLLLDRSRLEKELEDLRSCVGDLSKRMEERDNQLGQQTMERDELIARIKFLDDFKTRKEQECVLLENQLKVEKDALAVFRAEAQAVTDAMRESLDQQTRLLIDEKSQLVTKLEDDMKVLTMQVEALKSEKAKLLENIESHSAKILEYEVELNAYQSDMNEVRAQLAQRDEAMAKANDKVQDALRNLDSYKRDSEAKLNELALAKSSLESEVAQLKSSEERIKLETRELVVKEFEGIEVNRDELLSLRGHIDILKEQNAKLAETMEEQAMKLEAESLSRLQLEEAFREQENITSYLQDQIAAKENELQSLSDAKILPLEATIKMLKADVRVKSEALNNAETLVRQKDALLRQLNPEPHASPSSHAANMDRLRRELDGAVLKAELQAQEIVDMNAKLKHLEHQLQEARAERQRVLEEKQSILDQRNAQDVELQAEAQELRRQLLAVEDKAAGLESLSEGQERNLNDLRQQLRIKQSEIQELVEVKLGPMEATLNALRTDYHVKSDALVEAEKLLAAQETLIRGLRHGHVKAAADSHELEALRRELEGAVTKAQMEKGEIAKLEVEILEMHHRLREMQGEKERVHVELVLEQNQFVTMKSKYETALEKENDMASRIAELEIQLADTKCQLQTQTELAEEVTVTLQNFQLANANYAQLCRDVDSLSLMKNQLTEDIVAWQNNPLPGTKPAILRRALEVYDPDQFMDTGEVTKRLETQQRLLSMELARRQVSSSKLDVSDLMATPLDLVRLQNDIALAHAHIAILETRVADRRDADDQIKTRDEALNALRQRITELESIRSEASMLPASQEYRPNASENSAQWEIESQAQKEVIQRLLNELASAREKNSVLTNQLKKVDSIIGDAVQKTDSVHQLADSLVQVFFEKATS